jgi:hypothetical protein
MSAPSGIAPRELARESFHDLWRDRGELLRVAVMPVVITLLIDAVLFLWSPRAATEDGLGVSAGAAYALIALSIPPGALLAHNWLRVLLLGPASVPGLGVHWGGRETRFLLRMLLILLAGLAATFVVLVPVLGLLGLLGTLAGLAPFTQWTPLLGILAALLIYAYVSLRLSLALAATAIDAPVKDLARSWAATRGLGGRLVLAAVPVVGPFYVLTLVLPMLLLETGIEAVAPLSSLLLQVVLGSLASVAGFTVVAVAYRRLGAAMAAASGGGPT